MARPRPDADYVFSDAGEAAEFARLRSLERLFDPRTRRALRAAGVRPGAHCLEIGPGAGSVARWMLDRVGRRGVVTVVDRDVRFVRALAGKGARVLEADLERVRLPRDVFDVVHGRFVLMHVPERERVFGRLLRALKPGGAIVMEDPDFSMAVCGEENTVRARAFYRVTAALRRAYESINVAFRLGACWPATMARHGLTDVRADVHAPLVPGGSPMAEMFRLSMAHLRERLEKAGATRADMRTFLAACASPDFSFTPFATMSVSGRKPA